MHMPITSSSKDVSLYTINNCFWHLEIGIQQQMDITDFQLDTEDITTEEPKNFVNHKDFSVKDFIDCDKDFLTTDFRNLDQIYEASQIKI